VDAPARIGQVVKLYATGMGQTDPAGVDGAIAVDTFPVPLAWPSVTVAGIPAEVVSVAVPAQSVAGFFELAVRIPDGVPDGDAEVLVTSGDAVSQSGVTVAVATPAPMPDPEPAPEGLAADKRR
jgi:uncharacterized protein (TIGR03437 family)